MARARPEAPAATALREAAWRRLRHVVLLLPPLVRAEIAGFFAVAITLIAIRTAESTYAFDPSEPGATPTTHAARLLALAIVLAAAALATAAPRRFERAEDDPFLRALPIPAGDLAAARAREVFGVALPLGALGIGLFLPPLTLSAPAVTATALLAWVAWLWAAAMAAALVEAFAPAGRLGPHRIGEWFGGAARFLLVPALWGAFYAARIVSGAITDAHGALSLAVTALIGAGLGAAARTSLGGVAHASRAAADRVRERREIRAWRRGRHGFRRALPPLPRIRGGPLVAWMVKETALALRHRGARAQWGLALALEAAAIAVALRAAPASWALGGLLLAAAAAVAGVAILLHWSEELPGWRWGAPVSLTVQWTARALPALAVGAIGVAALVGAAWLRAGGGVARPLALWTVVCGVSLVAAANNLGAASPPRDPIGQNLYALGLLSATLVGVVFPVVGWAVLAGFAVYTARSLARDARP